MWCINVILFCSSFPCSVMETVHELIIAEAVKGKKALWVLLCMVGQGQEKWFCDWNANQSLLTLRPHKAMTGPKLFTHFSVVKGILIRFSNNALIYWEILGKRTLTKERGCRCSSPLIFLTQVTFNEYSLNCFCSTTYFLKRN